MHFSCSVKTMECGQIFILAVACRQLRKKAQHNFIGQFLNLLYLPRLVYSLSDGGGWSKMKVSFSVSSTILGKQDDPYPLPTRTQHFCQPVPYTNPYSIPTRTIYLTHVMRGSAAASGQAARARAAGVSTRDQRWSVRLQATDTPVP